MSQKPFLIINCSNNLQSNFLTYELLPDNRDLKYSTKKKRT